LAVAYGECQQDRRGTVPTYQYACTECGHAFDQFQSFSDDALTECPECQGRLRKLFNAVGVVFKGSGFYRNDSRDKKAAAATSDGKSDTKSDSGTETKSEPETEAKTEKKSEKKSETPKAPATA
jgi:putative FmdB family regulatory protein